jgi:DNA-binding MarR family transcriptional regulator
MDSPVGTTRAAMRFFGTCGMAVLRTMKHRLPQDDYTAGPAGLARSPIHLLHRAGQCAADIFAAEMGDIDLTPRQFAVLLTVSVNEGLSQTDLVVLTGIDRSTLADIVRRMLKKGLLQRRRTREDARAYAVKLTDEGARILADARPKVEAVDARILLALPGDQRSTLVSDLKAIVESLQSVGDGAAGTE